MVKRMRKFSNWFSCESFLCQSHLYMSFTYSKSLFHQNNLSLGLYHPEKSFYLGLRMNCQRNVFKIELRILWSHFKPHKTFTKADLGLLQLHWKPLTIITKALHLGCCSSPRSGSAFIKLKIVFERRFDQKDLRSLPFLIIYTKFWKILSCI